MIPILIKCLSAPDNMYGKEQGCVIRGEPGESTGRNVQRQQIPIALAKLNATEAIDVLKEILMLHHDYWSRYNSAYALAILMNREDSRVLEKILKEKKEYWQFLFPFGKGLIEKGDDDGVEYMAFKYSTYIKEDSLSSVLYMVEQRLEVLKNFNSKRTEIFYRQALEYKPLYNILVFDSKKVKFEDHLRYFDGDKQWKQVTNAEEALAQAKPRIAAIYKLIITGIEINQLEMLAGIISEIGKTTKDLEIRKISEECIEILLG
ncbi:MAG: HEAT repeat domain-containing protein [Omnitrophica bacterium]|nr:HEAT repeat domain-containing protein [Candidatus Omnitrophota bacterium]